MRKHARVNGEIILTEGCYLRQMTESDVSQVMEIENASFSNPWPKSFFLRELVLSVSCFMVVVRDEHIAGYIGYWQVEDEAQIMNIAVHPAYRRKGIAKELMKYVMRMMSESGVKIIYLEVREGNKPARRLYNTLGFEATGLRKQYYKKEKEDACLMQKKLGFSH